MLLIKPAGLLNPRSINDPAIFSRRPCLIDRGEEYNRSKADWFNELYGDRSSNYEQAR